MEIDINCDMGESFGPYIIGNDENIMPLITSANIACGFHGGDPLHIEETIKNAITYNVRIGAHPSYPDLQGFGRRYMDINRRELKSIIKYQIAAVKGLAESNGGKLHYVKPHGALYNHAAKDTATSETIISAIQEIDRDLILMGLAGSLTEKISLEKNIRFVAEAFADRQYEDSGQLRSRTKEGAVIHEAELAARQVIAIVLEKCVYSVTGTKVPIDAQTICIHGDNPGAIDILQKIDALLKENNILKKSFAG
jgi:UPF0271 protein